MRLVAAAIIAFMATAPNALAETPRMQVFKDAACGCCDIWIDHMVEHGFEVVAQNVWNLNGIKDLLGVPVRMSSCHTAVIDGFVVEGHVPAAEVRRLLDERPAGVAGIAVPGMPDGSPGMPAAVAERYDVLIFGAGASAPFATYVGEQRVE
ncbi:MAG: DUF411 domain-containing protein [Geminicoccaceae bacterium]|nr:MAG: DUF411 domain-containing protein [Geminicoccaceae bacterium]